ncbi:hypothetical protein Pelo_5138 [Pelomyxa schiedti]|nr:hypothetical protein Pelo_5138 [Pelomyxa schiedti]
MSIFRSSFQEIAFLYGTHILDLPLDVLSHIVGYLSPKSVFAARAVCLQFWSAVCQVYGCVNCTFSADVVKDASGRWIVSGSDIIVTPCMNFQVSVHTVPAGGIGVYFYVTKRKHYAQAKKAIIQLITPGSKKHKQSCFLETYHLADPIKPWGTVFTDLQANKTSKVHFSATLQDCSHTSRGKSSRPRVTKH